MFLDEFGFNDKTGLPKYGFSYRGTPAYSSQPACRSKNFSLLPAMSVDGLFAASVFEGSVTKEIFNDFVKYKVLPHCNPFPAAKSVIVMDNANIHRSEVS